VNILFLKTSFSACRMSMDNKKLNDPGFPLPKDGKQTSDLMSRLQVFLPQLQAANQGAPASSMIYSVWKRCGMDGRQII
jgi:hypothetical protein